MKGGIRMYNIDEINDFYDTYVNCTHPFIDPSLIHVCMHKKLNLIDRIRPHDTTITQKWILDHRNDLSDKLRTNTINFFVNLVPSSTCSKSYLKM